MKWWPENWAPILVPDAPVAELVVRGTAIYFFLYALMRVAGRRLLGRFSMSDIVVVLLIAVAVRDGITGPYQNVGDAMISALVIFGWDLVVDRAVFTWAPIEKVIRHEPTRIVHEGEVVVENARRLWLTRSEIMEKLRDKGVSSLEQVRDAYLEPDGNISVITRDG